MSENDKIGKTQKVKKTEKKLTEYANESIWKLCSVENDSNDKKLKKIKINIFQKTFNMRAIIFSLLQQNLLRKIYREEAEIRKIAPLAIKHNRSKT